MPNECTCPNCRLVFHSASLSRVAEYCPQCWTAWCKNNGSFEKRTKPISDEIDKQLSR